MIPIIPVDEAYPILLNPGARDGTLFGELGHEFAAEHAEIVLDDRGIVSLPSLLAERWFATGTVICRRVYGAVLLIPAPQRTGAALPLRVAHHLGTCRVDIHDIIGDAFVAGRRRASWSQHEHRLLVPLVA